MADNTLFETKLSLPLVAKGKGPCGIVTVISLCMSGLKEVWKTCSPPVVSSVLLEYREIVGRCVKDFHGFEAFSDQDQFLIVFQKPWDALNCCLTIQSAFVQSTWPNEVLSCQACSKSKEQFGSSGKTSIFNGPRVQIGITRGKVYSEYIFAKGSTSYSGSEVHKAVSIARIAKGGQVLVSADAWGEVQRSQLTPCVHKDTGKHLIEGCDTKIRLIELWLSARKSLERHAVNVAREYDKTKGTLRCFHCKNPLMDSYMVKEGLPFCLDDFFMLHSHTCHGCDTVITGSYVEAMSTYWHPSCFICQKCRRSPEKNENIYEVNALPFCFNCYQEVTSTIPSKEMKPTAEELLKHEAAVNS